MILLVAALLIVLLTMPLIGAGIYYKKRKGEVLKINQDKIRDPRFFGKSFSTQVEDNLSKIKDNTINLSKPEAVIESDKEIIREKSVDKVVIAREKDYQSLGVEEFKKEIYGGRNIIAAGHKQLSLRAAYSKRNMIIGPNTNVTRWLDAEGTLAIYDNCDLGLSSSSGIRMSVASNCRFRRLYAPEIRIGQYPEDQIDAKDGKNPAIYNMPVQMNIEKNIKHISNEMIDHNGVVGYTVISEDNLIITEDIIIQGDVRGNQGVRLSEGSVVCGNIFAEGDIYLGKNTCVLGNIFSQENIYFGERAVAGQKGRICSVIARGKITFEKDNFVFGYVNCEKQGSILSDKSESGPSIIKEPSFLRESIKEKKMEFKNLYEFEHVDQQGFRNNKDLEQVIIPNEAKVIPRSMFFNCQSLQTVNLPVMLEIIMPYSFADCKSLKEISLWECSNLKEINISSFENCESLESVDIPSCVKSIEGAAFSGCRNLRNVVFAEDSNVEVLGDHCFNGCKSLEEIKIPESVKKIGVSSFRGCNKLSKIVLAETCKDEPGILELAKEKLEFYSPKVDEVLVAEYE